MKINIVADAAIPFLEGVLESCAEVAYLSAGGFTREAVREADALIVRTRTRCDAQLLEGSRVRFIATATIGFDHIDMEYCHAKGIEVFVAEGCNARGVLQYVGAVLAELNLLPGATTLGVVGVGHVGSLVAEYGRRWGFRVLTNDILPGHLPLDQVVREADILTLHVPLDASTHHLVDERLLALSKPSTVIINTSRGGVVDEWALLRSGRRYILDTWKNEPHIDPEILENALLATPHIAGYSRQGKANATAMVVNALARHFQLSTFNFQLSTATKSISWNELRSSIKSHFDIAALTHTLKSDPSKFEALRNGYEYREEFF